MANQPILSKASGGYYAAKYDNGSYATDGTVTANNHLYFGYYEDRMYKSTVQFSIDSLKNKNIILKTIQLTIVQTGGNSYQGVNFFLTTTQDPFAEDGILIKTYSFNSPSSSTESPTTITLDFEGDEIKNFFYNYLKNGTTFYIRISCSNSNSDRIRITGPNNSSFPDRAPVLKITYSEGILYYGVNGKWQPCLVYYGVNGQWQQVIPYYGKDGEWKQLGGG